MMMVHNVKDRRHDWIGSWLVDPLDPAKLSENDFGRTVIYRSHNNAEAGTLIGWKGNTAFVLYHKGDTAAATNMEDLCFGLEPVEL